MLLNFLDDSCLKKYDLNIFESNNNHDDSDIFYDPEEGKDFLSLKMDKSKFPNRFTVECILNPFEFILNPDVITRLKYFFNNEVIYFSRHINFFSIFT